MASLGALGTVREAPECDDFDWFGQPVRTNPDLTDLALADFMEGVGSANIDDPAQALAAMVGVKRFLRDAIHPEDFDSFWAVGKANHQGLRDLVSVAVEIVQAVIGRPTGLPSDSTDGQSPTPTSSASDIERGARAAYPDRPDLRVAALRAAEQTAAS